MTIAVQGLHEQFKCIAQSELPQSRLGKAAAYALARWETLTRYAEPGIGHVLIDQNSVERGIRPTKLGAKNWLYIGHPDAGWRSAMIYSITGSCKGRGNFDRMHCNAETIKSLESYSLASDFRP